LTFRRGFKAEANRIALQIREGMGLRNIDPIDPAEICMRFDIQLIPLSNIAPGSVFLGGDGSSFSAVTVPSGHQTAIVHNDSHHPNRRRSNVCHELAHLFLGHKGTPPLSVDGERARDGGIEKEANFLAGALLIPNEAAIHIVTTGLASTANRIYGVSAAMLTFRLRVSGAHRIYERRLQNSMRRTATGREQPPN
jgi:Zn-dependent peptidase ImmA (M78 family)